MKKVFKVVTVVLSTVALSGCFSSSEDKTDPPMVSPTITASENGLSEPLTTSNPTVDGISAEEAKDKGVFAADGDATLTIISIAEIDGFTISGNIINISDIDETYEVVLLTGDGIVDTKIEIDGVAGETTEFVITTKNPLVTNIRLDGKLLGDGIDEIGWAGDE